MAGTYEIYALAQASRMVDRSSRLSSSPRGETAKAAYFFWVLRGPEGPIVVDTGFTPHQAAIQGVVLEDFRTREELLAAAGVDPVSAPTVILTHLHWDHFDLEGMFPRATFWLQRRELESWTGDGPRESWPNGGVTDCFAADMAALQSSGRLRLIDATADVTDGITLEWVGGHTPGLQIVVVRTAGGEFVLANDALTTYRNLRDWIPPAAHLNSAEECLDAMARIQTLSGGDESRLCPGHDGEIRRRFPQVGPDIYRLA